MRWFKIKATIFTVIIAWIHFSPNNVSKAIPQETFSPKEIIFKAIEANGEEEALRRLENKNKNNYTSECSLYSPTGEFLGTFTFNFKKPDKIREEDYLLLQNLLITRIYNAGRIYISADGKKVDEISQIEEFRKRAQLRSKIGWSTLLYLLDHQEEVSYLGEELVNGRKCFILEISLEEDTKDRYFFDAETFLLSKFIRTIYFPNRSIESSVYFYDFQKVEGVNFPFRMEVYQAGSKTKEMIVSKISFEELADSLFEVP